MSRLVETLKRSFQKMKAKGWDTVYVFVDMHETVVMPTWQVKPSTEVYPKALETLQLMSAHPNFKLILWSSSLPEINEFYRHEFEGKGVFFSAINANPFEADTAYADFKSKPYMSLILDDKAGFMPSDWIPLYDYMLLLTCLKLLKASERNHNTNHFNAAIATFLDDIKVDKEFAY